jgi:hypothetical protein
MFSGSGNSLAYNLGGLTIALVIALLIYIFLSGNAPEQPEGRTVSHETIAPPSTDPASEAKWTKHSVPLPTGYHVQLARASGRDTCVLGYDDAGKIYVGAVLPGPATKDYVAGASAPEDYVAADAAIVGGMAYVLFNNGIYFPDREPQVETLYFKQGTDEPVRGYGPNTPSIVCAWDSKKSEWEQVAGLPEFIDHIYDDGNGNLVLYCFSGKGRVMSFYVYTPGKAVRELYPATDAIVDVTGEEDYPPEGVYSFSGDKALFTVCVGEDFEFSEREWHRWLGILTPESHWGMSTPLSSSWSSDRRETYVLALPERNYVYVDGGLCEYSDNFLLLRRFRLPENMRTFTEQRHVTVMPIYGGLLAYDTRSRRLNVMLNPEIVED